MNQQEIYDTVARHLLTQGAESQIIRDDPHKDAMCAYRGANDTKCAIGCLITNEEYTTEMETKTVMALKDYGLLPERFRNYTSLLDKLQSVHDCYDPDEWIYRLNSVANVYELSADVLKEFA